MAGPGAADRALPHDLEVEKSVLGAVLLDNHAFNNAAQIVVADDFYSDANRLIFEVMAGLSERGEAIDTVTLRAGLDRAGVLQRAGGPAYVSSLIDGLPTASNVEQYARIIKDKSSLRQLISASDRIIREALDGGADTDELLDRAEHTIFQISEGKLRKGFLSVRDVAMDTMREIEELLERGEYVTGVPTGFTRLDAMTAGLQKGDLVILAARPSMGKTALALNIALHVALEAGGSVGFFSLEMSVQQVIRRLITATAQVDAHKLATGFLSHKDRDKLLDALHRLSETKFFVDDSAAMTVLEMRAKARRLKAEHGLDLLIIDYLQLMRGVGRQENRNLEIGEISRSIKALAKELEVPVIALSQLSRAPESRSGHRPQLSDLRECVTGDTLVQLADGRRSAIATLVGQQPEVVAVCPNGKLVTATSDKVWEVGTRPTFRVSLASGRRIQATGRHRLLGGQGWQRVDEMSPGDRIALPRFLPAPATPEVWPEQRVALLGQMIGDGSYLRNQRVPAAAFALGNEQIATLLRHLWATDGTISVKPVGGHAVHYATTSHGLAEDVAALLLRFGIVARIYEARKHGYRPSFLVCVQGATAQRAFLDQVGAFGPKVQGAERLSAALEGAQANTNVDTLPAAAFDRVRAVMGERGISHRRMAAIRGTSYGGSSHFAFAPSRGLLSQYAAILEDEDLRLQAESDLFWDRVVAIEPAGEETVFDLTVPGPASWIGNAIVSHNSGNLEQDADVVAFIFRPEVYADDPELEGVAELIISKQRNGPIGNVPLVFLKPYTLFKDRADGPDSYA